MVEIFASKLIKVYACKAKDTEPKRVVVKLVKLPTITIIDINYIASYGIQSELTKMNIGYFVKILSFKNIYYGFATQE